MNLPATARSRVCNKCKEEKTAEHFHSDRTVKSGLHSYCKSCRSENDKYNKIKRLYGLSKDEYESMNTTHCPICGSEEPLVVDHDHSTSKVRGLICNHCNLVLGHAKDNIETLKNAIKYLEQ
jgi:hypothetical protein